MQDEVLRSESNGVSADLSQLTRDAQQELREEMREIVDLTLQNVQQTEGLTDAAFEVVNQRALDFLDTHTIRVAEDISETTRQMIAPAVRSGIENGLSIDEIAGEIEGVPEYRAERIARTEMQTVAQGSRYESWKESGEEGVKLEWRNAPGATSAHQAIAARSPKDLGEPFVRAGEVIGNESFTRDVFFPPARPNCRCSIERIFEDEEDDE